MRSDETASRFGSLGFVASTIGVLMLIVAAAAIAVTSHLGDHENRAPAAQAARVRNAASTHATGSTAARPEDRRGCTLPPGNQTVPVTAPESSWTLVGAMAAPTAPRSFGPGNMKDGVRVCFAHNPTGALYALASFFAEATRVPQTELYQQLAADTPARAVALARSQGDTQLLQAEDGDPGTVSIAGFQYGDYTPALASITLVLAGPSGELAALPCSLEWQRGDWRFVIPASQQLGASVVSSMNGFVAWSAVNS